MIGFNTIPCISNPAAAMVAEISCFRRRRALDAAAETTEEYKETAIKNVDATEDKAEDVSASAKVSIDVTKGQVEQAMAQAKAQAADAVSSEALNAQVRLSPISHEKASEDAFASSGSHACNARLKRSPRGCQLLQLHQMPPRCLPCGCNDLVALVLYLALPSQLHIHT